MLISRADVASFSDFWSDHKILLKGIAVQSAVLNRYGIDFDEVENRREKIASSRLINGPARPAAAM